MKNLIFLLLHLSVYQLYGQAKYDYQWVLDHYNLIDFRDDSLVFSVLDHSINHGSGDYSTSICSIEGELLFYSGGCHILNANSEIMENGDSINSAYAYIDFCGFGDFPFEQSNTIIPFPANDQQFIYFNIDINIIDSVLPCPLHLYAQIIDMTMDGGLGAVIEKNKIILNDTLSRGYLQAVQHTNGIDWWVIAPEWNSNCYYIIPINSDGIGQAEKQCLGPIWNNQDLSGQAVFSPDGTKYARIEAINGWYLFDFDASLGLLSNPLQLAVEEENSSRGAAFSANSKYLYVSAQLDLFQFDLEAENIANSKLLVGQLNPDDAFPGVGTLGLQKLAPDGKIYIAGPLSHQYLSVINSPNCPGSFCNFSPWSVHLPESNWGGLPNLPHFNIINSSTACDSLVVQTTLKEKQTINIFPNPVNNSIFIQANESVNQFTVFNSLGVVKIQNELSLKSTTEVDLSFLDSGVYFIRISGKDGDIIITEKIIIQK